MVHGLTLYACGHERFHCPCCTRGASGMKLTLPVNGPCCGGPADKVNEYELTPIVQKETGTTELAWRKKRSRERDNS